MVAAMVVVSGLPGTGKSTIAERLAESLAAALLTKDVIEAALWRQGVGREQRSSWVAHEVLTSLAGHALARGQPVVIDSVAATEEVRRDWRAAAHDSDSPFVVIECICSDVDRHRRRLEDRHRGIDGWPELSWADVEAVRRRWQPWVDPHLLVDAAQPLDQNLHAVVSFAAAARSG